MFQRLNDYTIKRFNNLPEIKIKHYTD